MKIQLALIMTLFFAVIGCVQVERAQHLAAAKPATIAYIGDEGRLEYHKWSEQGDTLPDYSYAGYKGGGVKLPQVPTVLSLSPNPEAEDDTARIQAAIDKIGSRTPDKDGFRGALLLKKGRYPVKGTIKLHQSGVVLRGEGQDQNGTIIYACGNRTEKTGQNNVISIGGKGTFQRLEDTRTEITDAYVPVGSRSFTVADSSHFPVGRQVMLYRPATQKWLDDIRMSKIREDYKSQTAVNWKPETYSLYWLRKVEAVEGNRITIDAPIVNSLDKNYGGGQLICCDDGDIISNVGVENIMIESRYDQTITAKIAGVKYNSDENHAWKAVSVASARDGWITGITSAYMGYSCVGLGRGAFFFTVQDCSSTKPVSQITGSRRYSFHNSGQRNLFQRCFSSEGRHDFVLGSQTCGPNAFVDCVSVNAFSTSEPHHRWSQGCLWDNVSMSTYGLAAVNRGDSGTGHGWSGVQMCFWNCNAPFVIVQQPPMEQNFAVGAAGLGTGKQGVETYRNSVVSWVHRQSKREFPNPAGRTLLGDGWIESPDRPVTPRSLYLQQLKDRLGMQALENVTEPWQRVGLK